MKGGASNGTVIVAAVEITDREAAQALSGTELTVARGSLPAPEGNEVYHADLIGLAAETPDGAPLGRLVALHDFGAGEIAEVKPEKGPSVMLPFGPDYVPHIDLEGGCPSQSILGPQNRLTWGAGVQVNRFGSLKID